MALKLVMFLPKFHGRLQSHGSGIEADNLLEWNKHNQLSLSSKQLIWKFFEKNTPLVLQSDLAESVIIAWMKGGVLPSVWTNVSINSCNISYFFPCDTLQIFHHILVTSAFSMMFCLRSSGMAFSHFSLTVQQ